MWHVLTESVLPEMLFSVLMIVSSTVKASNPLTTRAVERLSERVVVVVVVAQTHTGLFRCHGLQNESKFLVFKVCLLLHGVVPTCS